MKKVSVSVLALVAAVSAAAVAHADNTPGWYAGAGVGGTFPVDPTMHYPANKYVGREDDVNLDLLGQAGYAWTNGLRVEGEYFHDQNNLNHVRSTNTNGAGHLTNNEAFANAFYDFKTNSMFTPYLGVGAGPDFVNVKGVGSPTSGYLTGDTLVFGYQGIAGVSAQLDPNWAVTADYRYISSFDPKVDATTGGQGRIDNASHNVIVGVRYSFATPEQPMPMHTAMAPTVQPRPVMQPAATNVPQNFTVFFDFNKATLTPEAKRIIASAAQEYKKAGFAAITVTGHTDTVGSDKYNQKLSDKRAMAVEAELKKMGISTQHIQEKGVGKDDLLVPTANGVREAQNRRAEIDLVK